MSTTEVNQEIKKRRLRRNKLWGGGKTKKCVILYLKNLKKTLKNKRMVSVSNADENI